MDAKSEFAYEGQKLSQRSLSAKMRKYVLLLNNFIFFMQTYFISSQILYAYSYKSKNIEKMFFITNVHMSALRWGQRSSSAIIRAFYKLFSVWDMS